MENPAKPRRHVRVAASSELPASAARLGEGVIREGVTILDVSVGGMAIMRAGKLHGVKVGDRFRLRLSLATFGEHLVEVQVRWQTQVATGLELVEVSADAATAIRRYVEELLERGSSG